MSATSNVRTRIRNLANVTIVDLSGEINGLAEQEMEEAYQQAAEHDPSAIVLNFTDVDYINSTGIALIVSVLAQARKDHRTLAVFGLSPHYQEIFQITRLSDFMTIFQDETAALQSAA
ncbi:MAG: STAS domain-containing protein [Anaerolineales bacterium]|jgi:anti-anti-sigma factor